MIFSINVSVRNGSGANMKVKDENITEVEIHSDSVRIRAIGDYDEYVEYFLTRDELSRMLEGIAYEAFRSGKNNG